MMRTIGKWLLGLALLLGAGAGLLWVTSPDPQGNVASFEDEPLGMELAPMSEATTLAQSRKADGTVATFLIVGMQGGNLSGIDLQFLGAPVTDDPFAALAGISKDRLSAEAITGIAQQSIDWNELLPIAGTGTRHIGTGTNFPEHAAEVSSDSVFNFPKFGASTPPRTTVSTNADALLDYEVELCMRFDRPITSPEDFDAATKGVFLCGDFTDRATLIRLIDPDNLDSGRGFSDGKSGPDFYPSGGLLVIPNNWQAFVASERFTTSVNGEPRQDARGGEMELDFRDLTIKSLADMDQARFLYQDSYQRLAPGKAITPDMTLMSGTSEGVIFTQPTRGDIIEGLAKWLFTARFAAGEGPVDTVIETFLANEAASGHFLQAGDQLQYKAAHLGNIIITVEPE